MFNYYFVLGLYNNVKHIPIQTGELPTEVYQCTSESVQIWAPILLVYKIIEIVFSLIFAFETRKIKVKELNDSRMVIFSVYTIVVAGIAVTPVIVLLGDKVTVKYAIVGIICLVSSTVLLGMNFIPKVRLSSVLAYGWVTFKFMFSHACNNVMKLHGKVRYPPQ